MVDKTQGNEKLQDFYKELELLLQKQLDAQPALDDVRLKLLELYFEQHLPAEFVRAARAWHRRLKDPAGSRDWQRVTSMGRMLLPGDALFSGKDSDVIEFIGAGPGAPQSEPVKIRRFGDDARFRPLFEKLAEDYEPIRRDAKFVAEHELALVALANRRPTPLFHSRRLSEQVGGAQIYIKREDLAGEAPHLTVALTGQVLLARRLGKKAVVIGTSDGRRAAIAAAIAARLGLKLVVFMDGEQAQRQNASVLFTRLMGAEQHMVRASAYRNRDVREAALEYWHKNSTDSFMLTGLDAVPAPYPVMTQEFTAAIGREARRQFVSVARRPPDIVAMRGAQSEDALALVPSFLSDSATRLVCVEAEAPPDRGRKNEDLFNQTGMPMTAGERKVARNILGRLEYPSVAREHAMFRASGRVEYPRVERKAARAALLDLGRCEGLIVAIETAHVLAWALQAAKEMPPEKAVLVLMAESAEKDAWDISQLVDEGK